MCSQTPSHTFCLCEVRQISATFKVQAFVTKICRRSISSESSQPSVLLQRVLSFQVWPLVFYLNKIEIRVFGSKLAHKLFCVVGESIQLAKSSAVLINKSVYKCLYAEFCSVRKSVVLSGLIETLNIINADCSRLTIYIKVRKHMVKDAKHLRRYLRKSSALVEGLSFWLRLN